MKTVLVTGANKGIGREVARQLAAKGFHVFVGARNAKDGRKAAEEIAKQAGKATFLEIDVADNGGEFGVPGLGSHGHGRSKRDAISARRRRHDCVARQRSAAGPYRQISA